MPGPVSFKSFPSALKRHPNKEGFACRGLWNPVEAASSSQPSDCSLKCLLSSAQAIYIKGFGKFLGLGADWGMSVGCGICHNLVVWDTQSKILLPRPPSCLPLPLWQEAKDHDSVDRGIQVRDRSGVTPWEG